MKKKAKDTWGQVIAELKEQGIVFDTGLSDAEINGTEYRFDIHLPPDLRAFLQTGLPRGKGFPDWRAGDERELRDWLDLPRQGILFDIEHNHFWLAEWGARPSDLAEAFAVASKLIARAPGLIPIYMHRMMPDEPRKAGNPVFSVHQTDIIHYGHDLLDYLRREFKVANWWTAPSEPRAIRFWDLDRFLGERWGDGPCVFDNRRGAPPKGST
jgi:hypothetical protein